MRHLTPYFSSNYFSTEGKLKVRKPGCNPNFEKKSLILALYPKG